jgi:hypothetical protein
MIYEKGITLTHAERERLERGSYRQDQQIAMILKSRHDEGFTFYDVVKATNFNQDSVKRSLSNMAGSGDLDKYKDEYGRFPIIKTDDKRLNPDTGINISVYRWNNRYRQPPTYKELYDKQQERGQMNFFEM